MPAMPWGLAPFCPLKAMKGCRWDFRGSGGTGTISIDTPDSTRRTRQRQLEPRGAVDAATRDARARVMTQTSLKASRG